MNESSDAKMHISKGKGTRRTMKRPRVTPIHPLPSDRHSYSVHDLVLRKFMTMTSGGHDAVAAEDVEGNEIPSQAASLNVRFWVDNGFLSREGDHDYRITPGASVWLVHRAISIDRGRRLLRRIIGDKWFAETARRALAAKPLMPREELQGELAMAAQVMYDVKKNALSILVDLLEEAGIVTIYEGQLRLSEEDTAEAGAPAATGPPTPAGTAGVLSPPASGAAPPARATTWRTITGPGFILQFDPTAKTVAWLKKYIEMLEEEIAEAAAEARVKEAAALNASSSGGSS
jgi:hypothetical protein